MDIKNTNNETMWQDEHDTMKKSLENAVRKRTTLAGAVLDWADLTGATLDGASLIGAKLIEASLIGANLIGAKLRGADLTRANLTEANLIGADLTGANLATANMTGAILDFSTWPLWCGSFGAIADDRLAYQIAAHLRRLDFSNCSDDVKAMMEAITPWANRFCAYRRDVRPIYIYSEVKVVRQALRKAEGRDE